MKTKKSYRKGGKVPPKGRKASAPRRPAAKLGSYEGPMPKTREQLTMDKAERDNLRKPTSRVVAQRSMEAGGRMGLPKDISGMGRFGRKLKKLKPIGPKKIMTGEMMKAASDKARNLKDPSLRKTVAEVEKPKRKKRRKFENGGKVKRTANVNLRGEGKKKEPVKNMLPPMNTRGSVGPTMEDYIRGERMARANMEKVTPRGPDVIGLAKKVKPGTIKKSSAKIPVPAKKKRRLRRK